jgi:hypothetical protein
MFKDRDIDSLTLDELAAAVKQVRAAVLGAVKPKRRDPMADIQDKTATHLRGGACQCVLHRKSA